jgi:hypothetical protein
MLRKISRSFFSPFAKFGIAGILASLSGCGGNSCGFLDRLFNEPSCHTYALNAQRNSIGGGADCTGASFSRKIRVNCPAGSGTTGQCSSALSGGTLYVVFVPNNNGGSFMDSTGTVYSDCGTLWGDFFSGSLQAVTGFFSSVGAPSGDAITCSDAGGCSLNPSQSCVQGWSPGNGLSGTASLPNGTSLLACVYIDNSFQPNSLAPPSIENWNTDPLTPVVISGDPTFTAGWKDAY